LIEPTCFISSNIINIREELNGLESTPLEETSHPKNLGIMSQHERSSIVAIVKLGETRKSSGTNVIDILIDIVIIYYDEEISGASLITPVPIREEGQPRETSSLTPEYFTSIP
jgi:hypothetical protein